MGAAASVNVGMAANGMAADESAARDSDTAEGWNPEVIVEDAAAAKGRSRGALCCAPAKSGRMTDASKRLKFGRRMFDMIDARFSFFNEFI